MKTTIYEPNKHLKLGIKIWKEMFLDLLNSRELIWRLFLRDWSARYKQAALGYLWAVVMPFVAIGTFVILNRAGILNIGETSIPYPLFALIGLTTWQLFSTGLNAGCNSLVSAGNMISKINFPLEALVFSSIAQAIFEFLIKMVLIIICFGFFQIMPTWGIFIFPLAVLPMLFLTIGLSFLLSLINGVFRDTANIVPLLTTFLMFLSPVLYPIPAEKAFIFKLNPLTALVTGPRDLIVFKSLQNPVDYWISSTIAILVFLISWRIFYLVKTKIPERV